MRYLRQYIKQIIAEGAYDDWAVESNKSEIQRIFQSKKPFGTFRNVQQETSQYPKKPLGLWYSCGNAWDEWLEGEGTKKMMGGQYRYEIQINPSTMYMISTLKELDTFHKRYKTQGRMETVIDWKAVQDDGYAGIEICPYHYARRMIYFWYYSWDVASGCIWDKSAIKGIARI